jgi:hypothetical protein
MLAKLTGLGSPTGFQVEVADGRITLTPARLDAADAVRAKLAELGIAEDDVTDAATWARRRRGTTARHAACARCSKPTLSSLR